MAYPHVPSEIDWELGAEVSQPGDAMSAWEEQSPSLALVQHPKGCRLEAEEQSDLALEMIDCVSVSDGVFGCRTGWSVADSVASVEGRMRLMRAKCSAAGWDVVVGNHMVVDRYCHNGLDHADIGSTGR